jgi:hypothetical protein
MSTPESLAVKVAELVANEQLFELLPAVADELPYRRTIWVTLDVLDAVNETDGQHQTALRHMEFGATLDAFINWEEISVSEHPFDKARDTFLARVDPVEQELWDIRAITPPPGMRCVGGFVGCDQFVALVSEYRENYEPGEFDRLVTLAKQEWERLFGSLTPHSGDGLDAYLTKYIVARA